MPSSSEQRTFGFSEVKQLRLIAVLLVQKQRVAVKMLVVADHDIARFQLSDKIRVFASSYHFNPVADQAHTTPSLPRKIRSAYTSAKTAPLLQILFA